MNETAMRSTLVTYKIATDADGKLEGAAKSACNFWNAFVQPSDSIVLRLGIFTEESGTIACAWKPSVKGGAVYGRIEFNTKYLDSFSPDKIAGTVVHEIGHTLGVGWDLWMKMFNHRDGKFFEDAIRECPELASMSVELDGSRGTRLSHWDEKKFGAELMTGYKNAIEHVLPVTIGVMKLFGHGIKRTLAAKTALNELLREYGELLFSEEMKARARSIDREYFVETEIRETIPHGGRV